MSSEYVSTLGPPLETQELITLAVAAVVAALTALARAIKDNNGLPDSKALLFAEIVMGIVAGIMAPLAVSSWKPISFGIVVVLGGLGGYYGYKIIIGIGAVVGSKLGIDIEKEVRKIEEETGSAESN